VPFWGDAAVPISQAREKTAAARNKGTVVSDITDRIGTSERIINKISEFLDAGTGISSSTKDNSFLAAVSQK
jgi:hypothetical protein